MNPTKTIAASLTLSLALVGLGCGPGPAGMENRAAATNRLDAFHAQFNYEQAVHGFEVGQFDKAQKMIRNAIAREPGVAEFHVLKGRIHLEKQELERALGAFTEATDLDENNAEAHYYTAIVFERWSNDEEAHKHYTKAFEFDNTKPMYLLAAAEALIAIESYEEAWDLIESKLDYFEHNAALRQLQGQIAALQGNLAQASALYSQARLLNPDDIALLEELVWVQFDAGEYGRCYDSLRQLKRAIREQRFDLRLLEARCLNLMHRTTESRDLYISLTQERPEDAELWIELGRVAWEMGDTSRLARCSNTIIALAPLRSEGYLFKGIVEKDTGAIKDAIVSFRKATRGEKADVFCWLLLGVSLEQMEDYTGALEAYSGALAIDPTNPEARALRNALHASGNLGTDGTD